jgi:hypothetical protein
MQETPDHTENYHSPAILFLTTTARGWYEQVITVGDTKEEPSLALVCFGGRSIFHKQSADEAEVGCYSSPSGNHDIIIE